MPMLAGLREFLQVSTNWYGFKGVPLIEKANQYSMGCVHPRKLLEQEGLSQSEKYTDLTQASGTIFAKPGMHTHSRCISPGKEATGIGRGS